MRICAIICEFNPFHNGHKYLLDKAKELTGADAILCIMSGSFTQRGEMCVLDKYVRARHAILGGADCVIQLPAPFAVAPAEIFAKGAIKILSAIPEVTAIAFGCESGTAQDFVNAANMVMTENSVFKDILQRMLAEGESFIKSYTAAFEACGGNSDILSRPNNVLGFEYTKSILRFQANIGILPITRVGAEYNDPVLKNNFSSATAIRKNLRNENVRFNLPDFVYPDLQDCTDDSSEFESMMRFSLFTSKHADLSAVYGCSEGLENKLKALENEKYSDIIEKSTSKRYTSARIRRILCANMLGLHKDEIEKFFKASLYVRPLAVRSERANEMLSALASSVYPIVTKPISNNLSYEAKDCFEKDLFEYAAYNHINHTNNKDYTIIV